MQCYRPTKIVLPFFWLLSINLQNNPKNMKQTCFMCLGRKYANGCNLSLGPDLMSHVICTLLHSCAYLSKYSTSSCPCFSLYSTGSRSYRRQGWQSISPCHHPQAYHQLSCQTNSVTGGSLSIWWPHTMYGRQTETHQRYEHVRFDYCSRHNASDMCVWREISQMITYNVMTYVLERTYRVNTKNDTFMK